MKMRRLLSALLALAIVMSCIAVGVVASSAAEVDAADTAADISIAASGSAYSDMLAKTTAENKYGLSETVNYGTILQAWNWSFANIEANLETVAEQGFTTIQVSPPNEIKKATKGVSVTQGDTNGWWMFYQPVGFQLNQSSDNALGTKAEFVSMCEKAHSLGLKVIVDAVINHVGTKDGTPDSDSSVMNHVNDKVKTYEPEIYNNQLFHSPWKKMQYLESNVSQYDSTYDLTRNCTSGLPDLKTEDSRVQKAIYDYLEELVSAGADGFRFDAAKHIETPEDISGLRSDFWTNTLKKVQSAHSDKEIYAYGEILNTCGVNRPYSMYTKLFDVTDSASYWGIKDAVSGSGGNATPYYPSTNFTKENVMLWDESHDTYMDGATSGLSSVQRGKIWALVAGRADISSVYLARPDDSGTGSLNSIKLGDAKKTSWSNATTKAINQFHNYFIGQSEYCTASYSGTAYIERGSTGAMIVNLGGTTSKDVTLKNNKLTAGEYKDAITGNTFTVTSSQIKGKVGSTGVAVIYENTYVAPTEPPVTYKLGDVDSDDDVTSVDVAWILRYAVDMVTFDKKQLLAGDVDGDGSVTVIDATLIQRYLAHMNVKYAIGEQQIYNPTPVKPTTPTPTPTTPTPYPTTPIDNGSFLLTDNFNWGSAYVYAWDADGNALNGEWPGASQAETQVNEYGETQFVCYVPDGAVGVILNNGMGAQTEDITDFSYDGYWMDGSQNELGHYLVTGWRSVPDPDPTTPTPNPTTPVNNGSFLLTDNFNWGSAYVYAWDAAGNAINGEWPGASQAETQVNEYGETQFVCYVPDGAVGVILNNGMGAQTEDITDFSYDGYWMDGSQNELGHYLVTGWRSVPDPDPTTPTPNPTTPVNNGSFLLTDNFNWGSAYVYAWDAAGNAINGEWPGASQAETQVNEYGETQFVCYVPEGAVGVILNNGNGAQTEDITDFSYDGYWMDGSQNELGHYIVTGWNAGDPTPDPDPDPDPDPTPTPTPTDGDTIIFTNNKGFSSVNIYYWADGSEGPVAWPGTPMTYFDTNEYGETRYSFTMPSGMTNYIINDGAKQTVDVPFTGSTGVYMLDTTDDQGHYNVGFYEIGDNPTPTPSPDPDPDPDPTPSGNDITFEPGDASVADPAWFAWVWNDGSEGTWISGTTSGSNVVFSGAAAYGNILVVRMPTGSTSADWSTCWNQSEDVKVQSGTLYFTGWGSGNKFTIGWK